MPVCAQKPKCYSITVAPKLNIKSFFDDYFSDLNGKTTKTKGSAVFFKEILYSYRILFGQDRKSWRAFRSDHDKSPFFDPRINDDYDSLLYEICRKDWSDQPVFDDVHAPPTKNVYLAQLDFPYFAGRLIDLQDFVLTQSPNNWTTLWRDRRDTARFWTLWAVIIFGTASLILSVLQVGIGLAQVGLAAKENQGS